jgi:predicted dienelactone hydrolase
LDDRPPDADGPRTLVAEIWYPAPQDVRGAPTVSYDLWAYLPEDLQAQGEPGAFGTIETAAVANAAVQSDRGPFPVVVFSHGSGGLRIQSVFFTVLLASHGYVVVSPDHPGNTLVELIRNRAVTPESELAQAFVERPIDVSRLLDWLTDLPATDPLHGALDLERIGIAGHSFGGLTAFRSAGLDDRIDAVLGLAPTGIGLVELGLPAPVSTLGIPTALQAAALDRTLPIAEHADTLWAGLAPPRSRLVLHRGGHFTFTHMCAIDLAALDVAFDIETDFVAADGCGPDNIPTATAFDVINHFAVGFFNLHLRGSSATAGLLAESEAERLAGDGEASFEADL